MRNLPCSNSQRREGRLSEHAHRPGCTPRPNKLMPLFIQNYAVSQEYPRNKPKDAPRHSPKGAQTRPGRLKKTGDDRPTPRQDISKAVAEWHRDDFAARYLWCVVSSTSDTHSLDTYYNDSKLNHQLNILKSLRNKIDVNNSA
jgi:hypothetical protein